MRKKCFIEKTENYHVLFFLQQYFSAIELIMIHKRTQNNMKIHFLFRLRDRAIISDFDETSREACRKLLRIAVNTWNHNWLMFDGNFVRIKKSQVSRNAYSKELSRMKQSYQNILSQRFWHADVRISKIHNIIFNTNYHEIPKIVKQIALVRNMSVTPCLNFTLFLDLFESVFILWIWRIFKYNLCFFKPFDLSDCQ